uniref:Dimer_Tnp_hAT domain-containing protein n=1 Tax=Globodera pallida TaxID=36090 RepID=A0A183C186_GLOPA
MLGVLSTPPTSVRHGTVLPRLTAHGISKCWSRVNFILACKHFPGAHDNINITAFEGNFEHADCGAHQLNLCVDKTLKLPRMKSILEKCRRTISHFNHSNLAKERLEDAQTQEDIPKHALIQDVPTRWNSSYLMGERLTEQRRALELYLCERDSSIAVQIAIANILLGELTEKNYPIIEEEQRKLISEIRERFSNLESKRFKDQFVPNRLEFVSKIHSWIN